MEEVSPGAADMVDTRFSLLGGRALGRGAPETAYVVGAGQGDEELQEQLK